MLNKEPTSVARTRPLLLVLPIEVLTTKAPKPVDPTRVCLRTQHTKCPHSITWVRPSSMDGNELAQSWERTDTHLLVEEYSLQNSFHTSNLSPLILIEGLKMP